MKHLLFAMMAVVISVAGVNAQDYSQYYTDLPVQLKQVQAVVIPDSKVYLKDFNAVADGKTLNTEAFKKAISALSKKGGGHLIVTEGVWKTGPIVLKSNIDLHVEKGAVILFSEDKSLYAQPDSKGNPKSKCDPFIRASKCENISITGEGVIDGQGDYWRPVKKSKASDEEWARFTAMGGVVEKEIWYPFNLNNGIPNVADNTTNQEKMRNHLISIQDSKNILIQGITLQNSPKFHLVPSRCQNLIIDGITVLCPWNAQNGDAIDIGNTQTVLVVNSTISCGDDGICMKGGVGEAGVAAGANEDYLIQNNTVYRAHGGFVIGSEFCAGMKRMVVRDCRFEGTDIGLRFKSAPGRGGTCEDIYCYDIKMKDIRNEAISFETGYEDKGVVLSATAGDDKSKFYPDFCNFNFSNIVCESTKNGIKINGLKGFPVHHLVFNNVIITAKNVGYELKNVENVLISNSIVKGKKDDKIDAASCKKVVINGVRADK